MSGLEGQSRWRWIRDGAAAGAWNMAVDEALLECSERPTLRFYLWDRATISLGYFQRLEDCPPNLRSLPIVRRLTGGGAILHERELTYSLVAPASAWPIPSTRGMVEAVHACVASALEVDDLAASVPSGNVAQEPFLCFERRASSDLVVGGSKILGSAQRSRRGRLLQHGSILLRHSSHAAHLKGVCEVGPAVDEADLVDRIVSSLARTWSVPFEPGDLSAAETLFARRLDAERYSNAAWTARR